MSDSISWITLTDDEDEENVCIHVVPIVGDQVMAGHENSRDCPCCPEVELYSDCYVITHNVLH